jgi:hypothetical protein
MSTSRMLQTLGLMVAFAIGGNAAEVVSIKAVPDGKAVNVITAIKTAKAEAVYHVWIYAGKTPGTVAVYDATIKALRNADQTDLDWLKERKIEGARLIVKLPVMPSSSYYTRSQKTVDEKSFALWKIQVYDSTNLKPIGEVNLGDSLVN